eukprot:4733891-Pyramimonas_sp.AAC.1
MRGLTCQGAVVGNFRAQADEQAAIKGFAAMESHPHLGQAVTERELTGINMLCRSVIFFFGMLGGMATYLEVLD